MVEQFIKTLLESDLLQNFLIYCEFHIVPILNPDGVVVGNSRVNLAGTDLM